MNPFIQLISSTPITTKSDLVGLSILKYLTALELPNFPLSPSHAAVVRVLSGADGRLTGEALHRAIGGLLPQLDQLIGELESHGFVARWSPSGSMVELAYELTEAGRRAAGMPGVYRLRIWLDYADGNEEKTAVDFTVAPGQSLDPKVVP